MKTVSRSALVPHSAEKMFALVDDVESYPLFLPWCRSATVHRREEHVVEASLDIHRGLVSKSFTTRNTLTPHTSIELALIGGPFRHLAGGWQFRQLGEIGSKVSLELEFEFAHRMTDVVFASTFEDICNSLVDAFTSRAEALHGEL